MFTEGDSVDEALLDTECEGLAVAVMDGSSLVRVTDNDKDIGGETELVRDNVGDDEFVVTIVSVSVANGDGDAVDDLLDVTVLDGVGTDVNVVVGVPDGV